MADTATPRDHAFDDVVDFPSTSPDAWFQRRRLLAWPEAATALGVTRSNLRRALDRARRSAGPWPLAVEGECNGRRFRAVRPAARRGIAWQFDIPPSTVDHEDRVSDLRVALRQGAAEPSPRPTPSSWLRRLARRLRSA